ncbi:hypothetical protein V3C99_011377 [Haemonchus contortus]
MCSRLPASFCWNRLCNCFQFSRHRVRACYSVHLAEGNEHQESTMVSSFLRKKRITEQFLHHSEFNRALGLPLTIALVCASSIPLLIFVLMPFSLTTLAGPSTLIAVIVTFLLVLISSVHMAELSSALPKNCVLYQFSFATLGELPAFFAGWTAVLDAVCITTILCRTWSEHVNLLFRRHLHRFMSLPLMHRESGMWIVSEEYDLSALLAAMMSVFILCCNLRVVGTISLCLIVVAVLMTASCTMVGFFHADPQNWISANFFRFGFDGVLRSICALSCAFAGVDAASYLFDETKSPRRKMTVLLPTLVTLLSLFFFVVVMIFSLSTDVSKLSPETLVPEMFSVLNVPAAKYMLTVAAVCGLSGAVLSSFLPGSRIINALSTDRLLPLPADITRRPVMSVFIFFILVSFGLLINRNVLLHVILLTTPLKMVFTICLVFLQHYRAEPVGMPHEPSHYKAIRKKQQRVSLAGNGESIVTSTLSQDEEDESEDEDDEEDLDSDTSFDTAVFLQMALAKKETQRLQRKLEKKQEKYLSETIPVLVKSVSHYNSMEPTKEMKYPGNHNCIADSCSARVSDDGILHHAHLYTREMPEVPYVKTYHGGRRSSTPVDPNDEYGKAKWVLALFLTSAVLFCQIAVISGFETVSSSVLLSLLFVMVLISVVLGLRLTTNDYLHRRQGTVPMFPYLTYITLFALIFALASTKFFTIALYAIWLFIGMVLYFMYGYWNSSERHNNITTNCNDEDSEMYRAIIGNDYALQYE